MKLINSNNVLFIVAVLLLIQVTAASADQPWNVTIAATNQLEPVTFGYHSSATDGFDGFDTFSEFPVLGKVVMSLDNIFATSIKVDNLEWVFVVGVPPGSTSTLTWDTSNFYPQNGLVISNNSEIINMSAQTSLDLAEGTHNFLIKLVDNTAPVADDQSVTTPEDTPVDITLSATDVDGNSLTYSIVDNPSHGTVTLSGNTATYTPTSNYNGADSFTFNANDGTVDSNTATVSITVSAVNNAPVADDQSVTTPEDTPVDITLSATDVDGNSLTYSIVDNPSHGTVTLSGNTATYTPTSNYNGADSFTFNANDGTVDSNTATVSITVSAVNDLPVADDQSVTTPEDTPVDITLSATDVDGNSLTYSIVDNPSHGTVTLSGNTATYTPTSNYNGADSFTFNANDGTVDSNTATVSITVSAVNDLPVADFTATPTYASEPLTVVFTDISTSHGGITAWEWDFNNNGIVDSTDQNPTHVYTQSGTYTVTLTVRETDGDSDTITRTDYITVTPLPDTIVASIYVNRTGWWRNNSEFNPSSIPIQHAINNATTRDVIYVYNGNYTENVNVNKQLTLIGEGTDVVIVTAAVSNDHVFEVTAKGVNISGFTVAGATDSQMAGIYLDNVKHCHIFDNNVSNNDCGIYLDGSKDNTLTGNIANSNNDCGIYLDGSKDNTLTGNTANSNNGCGIYLDGSNDNNLTANTANSNNGCGICLYESKDNTLKGNTAKSNNDCGINLNESNDNKLTSNIVTSNNNWGIYLSESKGNLIYDNYFNNTNNAYDDNKGKVKGKNNNNNIWNDTKTNGQNIISGSYRGGNYWSDYGGADLNGDGLGDTLTPYNSSGNIKYGGDYLPLVIEASVTTDTFPS